MTDILFELGCEELPPKALYQLSRSLYESVTRQLAEMGFAVGDESRWFASPRRLAFLLKGVNEQLPDQVLEKRGPAVAAAFDENGKPKPAALGFAGSVGASVEQLTIIDTPKGEYLSYKVTEQGRHIGQVLPEVIAAAVKQLPIPKPMRWGNHDHAFIRPVHWLVLLHGEKIVPLQLFGIDSSRYSRGHRFHHNQPLEIDCAENYQSILQAAEVQVDQQQREQRIAEQVANLAEQLTAKPLLDKALLQEVSSITERPIAVLGDFDPEFLKVPREALISSMEKHQKYFPLEDEQGRLMPHFVAFANIASSNPKAVKKGFEKVITPRLADAKFFWEKDKARALSDNIPLLEKMIFEHSLGSIADKSQRIAKLMEWLAETIGFEREREQGQRAALLMKSDLMSDMVDEFPDLQGLMGGYYAAEQGEAAAVATAIRDQYLPRFVGDKQPANRLGQGLSIADKLDTLCGIFAVGKKPSGSKDPFALRRAALSILAILQHNQIAIELTELIEKSFSLLPANNLDGDLETAKQEVKTFLRTRLKQQYKDHGVAYDVVDAVLASDSDNLPDIDRRIAACEKFKSQDFAGSLIASNKRIGNILQKADKTFGNIEPKLFQADEEVALNQAFTAVKSDFEPLFKQQQYEQCLSLFASLAEPLDLFFEQVMVNVEQLEIRNNRLALLANIGQLFNSVAKISLMVK